MMGVRRMIRIFVHKERHGLGVRRENRASLAETTGSAVREGGIVAFVLDRLDQGRGVCAALHHGLGVFQAHVRRLDTGHFLQGLVTAATQWPQVIPVTLIVVASIVVLLE
jgi:hypothetical protein